MPILAATYFATYIQKAIAETAADSDMISLIRSSFKISRNPTGLLENLMHEQYAAENESVKVA